MATHTYAWRGAGVSLHVPQRLQRIAARRPGAKRSNLVLQPVPRLNIRRRDPAGLVREWASPRPEGHAWYHTIELPGGEVTKGAYDHRPLVPHYGIPADLSGRSVLDVATADGFWAFEFERRGATVTATDLVDVSDHDFPVGVPELLAESPPARDVASGFDIASSALKSSVRKVPISVYDMSPERLGVFDLVHSADVLLHLADPLRALRAIRSVTGGRALIVDTFEPGLTGGAMPLVRYWGGWSKDLVWWIPSLDMLAQMVLDAGFADVTVSQVYRLPSDGPTRAVLVATV